MKKLSHEDPETKSADVVAGNIEALRGLFPEAFVEGKIDFEVLRQLLGDSVDEREEKFGLNWHGKRQARQFALTPSAGTLRPCPEESVDWDTTQNLMIEGDNLEVLKLLQKSYARKVKLIYIDPPYNTGGEFVYQDDYRDSVRQYLTITGQIGDEGGKLSSNSEASGRYHTNWLNMMYPRLRMARNLLHDEGLIFVSINDVEVGALYLVMNEIFGEENFEGHIHWRRRHNQPNDPTKMIGLVAEHILCYAKDQPAYKAAGVGKVALTGKFSNPDDDPRGEWSSKPWKVGSDQSGSRYTIITPNGQVYDEEWMGEQATYEALLADNRIVFPNGGKGAPRKKYFRTEREQEGQCATNWWQHDQFGSNQEANAAMHELMGVKNVFSNPKPLALLHGILDVANVKEGDLVVDFFAGSGTTGHAVLEHSIANNVGHRYVLVQLPEPLDPSIGEQRIAADFCDSIGRARNLAELTKERLRRAATKIQEEHPGYAGDIGFRVFKLDSTNIRAWDPDREKVEQTVLDSVSHLRDDRDADDILYELLLKLGLDLCVPIEKRTIAGKQVHSIGAGVLLACLAEKIGAEEVEPLAQGIVQWHQVLAPAGETTCVFRDDAFVDDVAKTNLSAILEQHELTNVRSL